MLPPGEPSASSASAGDPAEVIREEDSSRAAPTVLSLAYGCGQLAAALYDPASMTASLLRDTPDPPPRFNQLRALLGQLQPDQVRVTCMWQEGSGQRSAGQDRVDMTQNSQQRHAMVWVRVSIEKAKSHE